MKPFISGKVTGLLSDDYFLHVCVTCVQTGEIVSWNRAVESGWFAIKNPRDIIINGEPSFYITYLSPEGGKAWSELHK